jgi:hypothetical protein
MDIPIKVEDMQQEILEAMAADREVKTDSSDKVNKEVTGKPLNTLKITNKHMGVSKKEAFPVGAGYMGGSVNFDARDAREETSRRTGAKDRAEKELEFSPKEVEEIKKIAHYISERRMAGDNDGAKAWQEKLAKEYGLDENAFSKEAIEKLLFDNGLGDKHWTPEAQKFMQDWDFETAKKAFGNVKRAGEQTPNADVVKRQKEIQKAAWELFKNRKALDSDNKETEPSEFDLRAAEAAYDAVQKQDKAEKTFHPPVVVSDSERERSVVPVKPDVYVAEPIPGESQPKALENKAIPKAEDLAQAELNKAITDFEAKQAQIAEMRAKKAGRWTSLRKTLGLETRNIDRDPEVMGLEKESQDLYRSLLARGINLYKGDKSQLEIFLKQFDEFEVFKKNYNQELDKKVEIAGYPEKISSGLKTLTKKWSELGWKQKIAISMGGGLLFAGGAMALGAGTLGAATLTAGWRWGFRAFGATAAGVGKNVMLDRQMMATMEKEAEARLKGKMDFLEKYENNLDQGIEKMLSETEIGGARKDFEQRKTENALRATRFGLTTFAISSVLGESFRYASQATGINMGTILRKIGHATGLWGVGGPVTEITAPQSGRPMSAEISSGTGKPPESVLTGEFRATEHSLNPAEQSHADNAAGAIDNRPVSGITEPQAGRPAYTESSATEQPHYAEQSHTENPKGAIDHRPVSVITESQAGRPTSVETSDIQTGRPGQIEEISSVKIRPGGTMWGGIESKIKANPSAFGLDPKDPNFTKNMHRMTQQLLDEFAYRKGMSYEELDQIARTKVMAGDSFKLMYDPSTEELSIDDFHGKAFGSDIQTGGAARDISSLEGGKLEPENAKSGASTTEHQPSRGSRTKLPNEILENERIAKEDFAKADQYQKDIRAYNAKEAVRLESVSSAADTRLFLSTRGLLNQLVNGAGVGDKANFWQHSMNDWEKLLGSENYIAQDIQLADETRIVSFDKLKKLLPILEPYHRRGIESIGDCLREAVKNPKVLLMINRLVLKN